jgi:hypothetical protein
MTPPSETVLQCEDEPQFALTERSEPERLHHGHLECVTRSLYVLYAILIGGSAEHAGGDRDLSCQLDVALA